MTKTFAVAFDYRCPFARNGCEHVLDGLAGGADWDVRWVPFSLSQAKEPTWERPTDSGLLALELAVAIRDHQPELFADAHRALFAIRHDEGRSIRDDAILRETLESVGVDVEMAMKRVDSGESLATVRSEHEWAATTHTVWGVPTFMAGDQAAFVRLMDRPATAQVGAVEAVERIVDLLRAWPALNEFKHTSLPR
jgi:hypothetical protein